MEEGASGCVYIVLFVCKQHVMLSRNGMDGGRGIGVIFSPFSLEIELCEILSLRRTFISVSVMRGGLE